VHCLNEHCNTARLAQHPILDPRKQAGTGVCSATSFRIPKQPLFLLRCLTLSVWQRGLAGGGARGLDVLTKAQFSEAPAVVIAG